MPISKIFTKSFALIWRFIKKSEFCYMGVYIYNSLFPYIYIGQFTPLLVKQFLTNMKNVKNIVFRSAKQP